MPVAISPDQTAFISSMRFLKGAACSSVPKHCLQRPFELGHELHLLGAAKASTMPRFAGGDMGHTHRLQALIPLTNGVCLGSSGGRGHEGADVRMIDSSLCGFNSTLRGQKTVRSLSG
jgi:hypothetical protein